MTDGVYRRYDNPGDGGDSNSNGTNAILFEGGPNSWLVITKEGGGLFDFLSIDMTISWYDGNNVEVVAINGRPITLGRGLRTYLLDLHNVSQVSISGVSSYSGFWLADNVVYNDIRPVPLGASWTSFLTGLLGVTVLCALGRKGEAKAA